ncbi:MAG: ferrous iron transport protein B [Candidatus Solibacter usitatus]|nr:ferrous iron transport protein B [Candidatus Solibacter usitatus]
MGDCHGCGSSCVPPKQAAMHKLVAIIGPPNSGKSTLFNRLTGLRQKVANFPGVTVEHHTGKADLPGGHDVELVDLPGVYSLHARSEDERVSHDVLHGKMPGLKRPDGVILILDATNLSRHLPLAASVLSLRIPTLVVLNMADDMRQRGGAVDTGALADELGAPVVLASATTGEGVDEVARFLSGGIGVPKPVELPVLQDVPACRQWAREVSREAGYTHPAPPVWTRRLDAVFLHAVWGPLSFVLVVGAVFQTIFTGARPLMGGVEWAVGAAGGLMRAVLPEGVLRSLLVDGVWSGVGAVLVFMPQILLLFLFITVLEDSGYLARAALIADRTMARVGLQGKSFIPLLSAYACAVPAIMATRTIENKRDRIATILIAPFMTCSARLPVYTLIIAAFIPDRQFIGPFVHTRAAALMGLYVLGFAAAVLTARVLKSSILKSERTPFVLEMPPYRVPSWRTVGLRLYDRAMAFLKRAGTVILGVSVVLWALASIPLVDGKAPPIEQSLAGTLGRAIEPLIKPLGFNWKIGIGLVTSLAAREVIVGTLGTIYGMEPDKDSAGLQAALQKDLTFGGAVALLVFFAFAMQCMSTLAVVRRETGGWKWPAVQFAYMGALAWLCALAAYKVFS